MKQLEKFFPKEGFGVCGFDVVKLVRGIAEAYGDTTVKIVFPYATFNMKGPADKLGASIVYDRSFIHPNTFEYMFYDTRPVQKNSYLPIYAETDVYFIKSINNGETPEINLEKAPSWRTYL